MHNTYIHDPECPLCTLDAEIDEHMASCEQCNESDAPCDEADRLFAASSEAASGDWECRAKPLETDSDDYVYGGADGPN